MGVLTSRAIGDKSAWFQPQLSCASLVTAATGSSYRSPDVSQLAWMRMADQGKLKEHDNGV